MELLIARNDDPDSKLPYLLRVPLGAGELVFRTKGTWPRTSALYCHPVPVTVWVPRTLSRHATCTYSCRRPPSRSRRSGRRLAFMGVGGGVRPVGGC
jgi:hypothetical protein